MTEIGTGNRHVCELGFDEVPEQDIELLPGDILLCKTAKNPLSNLIAKLDGWWCHTALSLGGSAVAHSNASGLTRTTIAELAENYEAGLGVARPKADAAQREAAAEWAEYETQGKSRYGAQDLGTAFSILWRASRQPSSQELMDELTGQNEFLGAEDKDWTEAHPRTCSGFAYQAFALGADHPLEIIPAPGVRLEDGFLRAPDYDELLEEARRKNDVEVMGGRGVLASIGLKGSVSAIKSLLIDEPVPIEIGVTPGDMWMSPSHEERWFIQGRDHALSAMHDCDEHG